MAKTSASKNSLYGAEILEFLKTFEGALAYFEIGDRRWSLWMPELAADERPLTPTSQIFFPVILRPEEGESVAVRFLYDCESGKVRYYTSVVPEDVLWTPEFENALAELFNHSVPVESVIQRTLQKQERAAAKDGEREMIRRSLEAETLAEPVEEEAAFQPEPEPEPEVHFAPAVEEATFEKAVPAPTETSLKVPEQRVPVFPPQATMEIAVPPPTARVPTQGSTLRAGSSHRLEPRTVRFELGPRARSVLVGLIVMLGLLGAMAIGAHVYLAATEDPGVQHHRMQIEAMRLQQGR